MYLVIKAWTYFNYVNYETDAIRKTYRDLQS